jgi:hypothetical protein
MRWLLFLLLALPARAQTLTLEFAQQGDPQNPRALIVIHRGLTDRSDLKPFFTEWNGSWGVNQFCSVYSYTYPAGLAELPKFDALGADLLQKVQNDDFDKGAGNDPINAYRRVVPTDARQPQPTLRKVPLYVLGHGTGGLIAREFILAATKQGRKVTGVTYVATPLDGVPQMLLATCLRNAKTAAEMGLATVPNNFLLSHLAPGWGQVSALWDASRGWLQRFTAAYATRAYQVYGTTTAPTEIAPRVLYSRGRRLTAAGAAEFDGWVGKHAAMGDRNGPATFVSQTPVPAAHCSLIGQGAVYQVVIQQMLDPATWYAYLAKREAVELMFKKGKSTGTYYDERSGAGFQPQWKPAYALPAELYKNMWVG